MEAVLVEDAQAFYVVIFESVVPVIIGLPDDEILFGREVVVGDDGGVGDDHFSVDVFDHYRAPAGIVTCRENTSRDQHLEILTKETTKLIHIRLRYLLQTLLCRMTRQRNSLVLIQPYSEYSLSDQL